MGKIEDIKYIRDKTGCGIAEGKHAIELCKERDITVEYLKLRGQALARYKYNKAGKRVPWNMYDYYKEAKHIVKKK